MRLNRDKRRRSQTWWALFNCACLAMALYIAFDLLDLDGSELRDPRPNNAIAAAAETERVFPRVSAIPEILGSSSHSPVFRSVSEVSQPSPCLHSASFGARLAHLRRRAYLKCEAAAMIPSPDDPA